MTATLLRFPVERVRRSATPAEPAVVTVVRSPEQREWDRLCDEALLALARTMKSLDFFLLT